MRRSSIGRRRRKGHFRRRGEANLSRRRSARSVPARPSRATAAAQRRRFDSANGPPTRNDIVPTQWRGRGGVPPPAPRRGTRRFPPPPDQNPICLGPAAGIALRRCCASFWCSLPASGPPGGREEHSRSPSCRSSATPKIGLRRTSPQSSRRFSPGGTSQGSRPSGSCRTGLRVSRQRCSHSSRPTSSPRARACTQDGSRSLDPVFSCTAALRPDPRSHELRPRLTLGGPTS